jgi:flavorubredoxin
MSYQQIEDGVYRFSASVPLEEGVYVPINNFAVIGSHKKILIDTGMPANLAETIKDLSEVMHLADLDYVFISHLDIDHIGGLAEILKLAPKARIVSNMTCMAKGTIMYDLSPMQFAIGFPGQDIDLGDRKLQIEDAFIADGNTNWLFDTKTHTYFSSDAFGSLQFGEVKNYADEVPADAFAQGFAVWQHIGFALLPRMDANRFRASIDEMRRKDIKQIASVHGPVIRQDLMQVYELMASMPTTEPPPPPTLPPFMSLN